MAQPVKDTDAKSVIMSSSSGTHIMEGGNRFLHIVVYLYVWAMVCMNLYAQTHELNKNEKKHYRQS